MSEEKLRQIKDWVEKEINILEIQKDSTFGISQYGVGKLDALYRTLETINLKQKEVQKK